MPQGARPVLHPALKPHDDASGGEELRRYGRRCRARARPSAPRPRSPTPSRPRRNDGPRPRRRDPGAPAPSAPRQREGGAERQAAVSHVREDVDVLDLRQQARAPRAFTFETTPPASATRRRPVSRTASRTSATTASLDGPLRDVGELLVGNAPENPRASGARSACAGTRGPTIPSATRKSVSSGLSLVGDGAA